MKKKAEKKKSRTLFLKPLLEGTEVLKVLSLFANGSSQAQLTPTLTCHHELQLPLISVVAHRLHALNVAKPLYLQEVTYLGSQLMTASSNDNEPLPDDCEITVMKKMTKTVTTTMTTTHRSATPQPTTGTKMQNKGQFQTSPSTPLHSKAVKRTTMPSLPCTPTPCTLASCTLFAPFSGCNTPDTHAPFPTAPRYSFPASPTTTKRATIPVFGPIHYHIPHPNTIVPPPYVDPSPKMWYAVTVGQDVGVFNDWLLVKKLTDNVTGVHQKGYKSFYEALRQYHEKFLVGAVICCPHIRGQFFDPLPVMCSVTASDKRLVGGNDLQPTLNLSQLYTITN
ncbi:hypothetical protein EV421DRAFT_1900047 [Armillaria borealis]|uniref:Ribonuclease H1 N-terminal domain-containing protein n=1 Tax=Armillaria borealis TaxID=47425 RepID=A0AA39MX68_9AGAR|nr:hypothetical protein EV421DRAFT_1900047 [Armillaria borealis]